MAVSLFLNKTKADLYEKPITRKIQIGEVSEVAERKSSFSYTIKLPKTSKNKQIFEMLGVSGNTSRKPYEEIVADYVVDTVYLVQNGSAIIRETSNDFQVNIIDGVRSLAELLRDKKLIDLPLDDLNHILSTQNYIDSYQHMEGFIYGIANYGRGVTTFLKVEKQAPSIYTHTLFRRIFEANGLTLQGEFFTTNEKYLNEVVTPSRGYTVEFAQLQSDPKGGADSNVLSDYQFSNEFIYFEEKFTLSDIGLIGASIVDGNIEFSVAGTYRIDLSVFYSLYETYGNIQFRLNGSSKSYIYLEEGNSQTKSKSITFTVDVGDTVSIWISGSSSFEYEDPIHEGYTINYSASVDVDLYLQTGGQLIQASDYIGDMSQLDFLKDVVNRYGLVLHPVQNTNEFKFKRLEALLNDRETAEDWTSKLAGIDTEKYVSGYAKTNKANYQYPEATVVPTHDGEMLIDNENANTEKTMFSSPFEIPVESSKLSGNQTYLLPVWGEESQGTAEVETELNFDNEIDNIYLKTDGDDSNLFDIETINEGFLLDNGVLVSDINYDTSDYIPVVSTSAYYNNNSNHVAFYDTSKVFIPPQLNIVSSFIPPSGAAFVRVDNNNLVFPSEDVVVGEDSQNWKIRRYDNIDVANRTYKASGRVEFAGSAFVCFYDINDNFISYQFSGSGSQVDYDKTSLFIPSNCKIIRITGHVDSLPVLYEYEEVEFITAVNEETPLKIMHVERIDISITAKFFNEVTGITVSEGVPFLNLDFISLEYFLSNFYKAFQSLIENYKKVSLSVNLSVVDIFNLDFFRLKYLKQTGRFYYLNAVQNTTGKISSVEAIEIKEFPQNQPPSQIGNFSFNMNHGTTRTITLANLSTGYEDPELDEPLKIKIISGFNADVLLKQDGIEITAETEINVEDLALTAVEVLGGLDAYSKSWVFTIADKGSGTYGVETGILTANVLEYTNFPPVANAGEDQLIQVPFPDEFPEPIFVTLNGSASYDNTGEIVSYFWEIISKPPLSTATLSQNTSNPLGYIDADNEFENIGTYVCRLTVTDEFGATDDDEVTIEIEHILIP